METTIETYLKGWVKPEIFAKLVVKDIKVFSSIQPLVNQFLDSKDLVSSFANFGELLLKIFQSKQANYRNLGKGITDYYTYFLDLDDLDDMFYILLGRFIENGYDNKCYKQCWDEFLAYYVDGNYKEAREVIKNYKDKKCGKFGAMQVPDELPKQIGGF